MAVGLRLRVGCEKASLSTRVFLAVNVQQTGGEERKWASCWKLGKERSGREAHHSPGRHSMHQNTSVPPNGMQNGLYFWLDSHFLISLHYEKQMRLPGGQLGISATISNVIMTLVWRNWELWLQRQSWGTHVINST